MCGNAFIGSTVTGRSSGIEFRRVMHISLGEPLISAEQEPHLPCLAIPAHGEIERLRRLNLVNRVEHHHSFRNFDGVIAVLSGALLPAPNSERCVGHHFIS